MGTNASAGSGDDGAWQWLLGTLDGRPVPSLVVVIGLGNGALLRALDARAPGRAVVAFEPDPGTAAAFLAEDWTSWRASGRLTYLAAPDYAGESEAWRAFPDDPEDHVLLVAPHVARVVTPEAVAAAHALKRILYGARANAEARRRFAPRYLVNALRNLPALAEGRDLAALKEAYRGRPAIVVAAGPSLDTAIDDLRMQHRRALLIAVDTALRPLLAAGIEPDLVVGLDPGEANARHFLALPRTHRTWLASETALDPSAASLFGHRTLWFRVADHQPWPWLRTLGIEALYLDVWGSVITAAFQVAVLAGCDPIVFVGADLSHRDVQPYARGTSYEFDWARWTAAGMSLDDVWRTFHAGGTASAEGLEGRQRTTTPALLAFRDWLVTHAQASGRRVVNAADGGLLFGGGLQLASLAATGLADGEGADLSGALDETNGIRADAAWRTRADELLRRAERGTGASPFAEWAAFSGSGWNRSAVLAALADAVASRPDTPVALPVLPYPVLSRLPECIQRWRAVLRGDPRVDRMTTADRGALLDAGLTFIDALRNASARLTGDTLPPLDASDHREPMAARITTASELGWLVMCHEALMGAAAAAEPPQSAFFSAPVVPREPEGVPAAAASPNGPGSDVVQRMVLDWMRCASDGFVSAGGLLSTSVAHALADAMVAGADPNAEPVAVTLHVKSRSGTEITLRAMADVRHLARIDTGILTEDGGDDVRRSARTFVVTPDALQGTFLPGPMALDADDRGAPVVRLAPRVLTDAGTPRASIAYTRGGRAVCVSPYTKASFEVHEDGSTSPGREWPLPILNELPDDEGGWIAWTNGMQKWNRPSDAYALVRTADGTSSRLDLPFRPTWGAWHKGRLHWTCFPSGLGVWAPDTAPKLLLDDLALMGVCPHDDGLLLMPVLRDEEKVAQRRRATSAWHWTGNVPAVVALDRLGQWSAREERADGWRATAFPEADRIRLETPDARVLLLICHRPFKLAWLGGALLVSTIEGDLLLFEQVGA